MLRPLWTAAVVLAATSPAVAAEPPKLPPSEVFDPATVWQLALTLSAEEYAAMQPPAGFPGFGFPGGPMNPPPKAPVKPGEQPRETHRNTFGVDLPWARGSLAAEGRAYANVGIRYKGNGTILETSRTIKRSLKVDLDKHDADQRFHGLKVLNLHCGVADPSKARETLAYALYRAAGVPAARTTLAEVTLTVPGKFDKEYLGLYTVVESVDKAFLKAWYKADAGLLMKPERIPNLAFLGDDWERYKATYQPKRDATKDEARRVIEFVKLVNQADDATFRREIGSYLDVDAFLRFLATTAFAANMDSFFALGHNYYLYLHPGTHKFHFIPWDLDRAFANFPVFGTPDQLMDLNLSHPYAGQHRLVDRLLAMKDVEEKYRQLLKDLAATAFAKDRLLRDLTAFETVAGDALARDAKAIAARRDPPSMFGRPPELRTFIDRRTESVAAQLAGKSKGYTPTGGFGPPGGGPGGPPPRPGELVPAPLQQALRLTDEQKKKLAALQKETDAKLDELLTEEQRATLKRLREGRPGGFGPPGGPGR
jgi:spore coat protein CotH